MSKAWVLEDSLKVRGGWISCRPTLAEHTTRITCLVFHGQRSSSQEPLTWASKIAQ